MSLVYSKLHDEDDKAIQALRKRLEERSKAAKPGDQKGIAELNMYLSRRTQEWKMDDVCHSIIRYCAIPFAC